MKFIVLLLLIFFYLFFSYIRFYHFIGDKNLKSPYIKDSLILENPAGKGSIKYAALGDSLTAGVGSSNVENTFVYIYALKLLEKNSKVQILNFAQPGGTTADVINYQIPKTIAESPDFVTLLIGVNDIHNKRTSNDFKEKYSFILNELLTKTNAKITIIEIPYIGSNKIVYPPFNYLLNFRTQQFNNVIYELLNEISDTDRVRIAPIYNDTYILSKQNAKYYSSDLFHPSEEGYIIWGQMINAY